MPFAFTEQGVAMLSSVLKSERAIQVNRSIIRAFYIKTPLPRTREAFFFVSASRVVAAVFLYRKLLLQLLKDIAEVDLLGDDCVEILDLYALLLH